jgi:MFS family permease
MQRIAQDWLVLELTGSVTAVGIAVALQFLPVLLFGLFGGVIADRYPKRTLLLITQSMATLMAVTLGVLALSGAVQVWHVYAVATLLGFVTVVDNPTRQVFVAELVGDDHIRNAVSLNSSVFQLGALIGPALSGLLIHAFGQGWSFLINAASCLVVVTMLLIIRPRVVTAAERSAQNGQQKGALRQGLHYIRETSEVAWTIILVAAMGLLALNMPVILAAFADDVFTSGVGGYSLFNSLTAIGALAGALLSARRREMVRLRSLVASLCTIGLLLMAASLAPSVWVFGSVLVAVGCVNLLFMTGANSLVQMTTAPALRGRVMGLYILVLLGGQAIGSPTVGWLIDHIGARTSMLACGGLLALVALGSGIMMARKCHLTVDVDVHRDRGRAPLHIVHT